MELTFSLSELINPMYLIFYTASFIALLSTFLVITIDNAVHALLYLVVSLFSVAVIFFTLQSSLAATLEIIVYAGAIMVLFIFVVMLLNFKPGSPHLKNPLPSKREHWFGPIIMSSILLGEILFVLTSDNLEDSRKLRAMNEIPATLNPGSVENVTLGLFQKYPMVVEIASFLLLAGLVGAYHLARKDKTTEENLQQK
jgi:NADH-quinone oxidoreductase subunit J